MKTICICGAGTMGLGIAQVCATAGYTTLLFDVNAAILEKAKAKLDKDLQSLVDKGKMDLSKKEEIEQQICFTSVIEDCRADLVIEAIIEDAAVKTHLFGQLSQFNSPSTIFASNTSSLSVSALARGVAIPRR